MKTIVIYNDTENVDPMFFVVEGDFSHLDRVVLNSTNSSDAMQDELMDALGWDDETGVYTADWYHDFPLEIAKFEDVKVICVGFLS